MKSPVRSTPEYWFQSWCEAARWRRAVDEKLAPFKLAHTRYLLLDIAERIESETDDAFKQRTLVKATNLDESTVSTAVRALEAQGLIDRGSDAFDVRQWRLRVTTEGRRLLARTRPIVQAVAVEFSKGSAK